MEDQEAIEEIAGIILHEDPDPVVRFRLLRDVLKEPPNTDTLMNTRRELLQSRWVLKLGNEQIEAGADSILQQEPKEKLEPQRLQLRLIMPTVHDVRCQEGAQADNEQQHPKCESMESPVRKSQCIAELQSVRVCAAWTIWSI